MNVMYNKIKKNCAAHFQIFTSVPVSHVTVVVVIEALVQTPVEGHLISDAVLVIRAGFVVFVAGVLVALRVGRCTVMDAGIFVRVVDYKRARKKIKK